MGEMSPKAYRPSNGTDGMAFALEWCGRCMAEEGGPFDEEGKTCPILTEAFALPVTDEGYPPELVEDKDGPRCIAFIERAPGREGWLDPREVARDRARYEALPRDPATGRPVIA